MKFSEQLIDDHDIRIDNHEAFKREPPFYYEPLQLAFKSYFNTFYTFNAKYGAYASGIGFHSNEGKLSQFNFLDSSNTAETVLYFQRFFEHYLKDQLYYLHPKLVLTVKGKIDIQRFSILLNEPHPETSEGRVQTIQFKEAVSRFYLALKHPIARKSLIERNGKGYAEIFESPSIREVFNVLGKYRNRLLHNGSKVPSLWMLDFLISQGVVPIIRDILKKDQSATIYPYYLKTPSGLDILNRISEVKFDPTDMSPFEKESQTFKSLMTLGHLKELGRASLKMTHFARRHGQVGHEYNYTDIWGRGQRFAIAEQEHKHFESIKNCPCCENLSLVRYSMEILNILNQGEIKTIKWVKCYTCEYHLRMNTGEPKSFDLALEYLFS